MLVVPNDASAAEAVIECFEFGLEAVEDVATASILESCERSLANALSRALRDKPMAVGSEPPLKPRSLRSTTMSMSSEKRGTSWNAFDNEVPPLKSNLG